MAKVNEDLRKELLDLRIKLDLLKKERIESDDRIKVVQARIKVVKSKISQELAEKKGLLVNGKRNI